MVVHKTRIAGIIVQDCKILMVKGTGYKELWTPGGKVDAGETDEQCLYREIQEEIGMCVTTMTFFQEYIVQSHYAPTQTRTQRVYIVNCEGQPVPSSEIESYIWLSKKDFDARTYPMIPTDQEQVFPDLIKAGVFI